MPSRRSPRPPSRSSASQTSPRSKIPLPGLRIAEAGATANPKFLSRGAGLNDFNPAFTTEGTACVELGSFGAVEANAAFLRSGFCTDALGFADANADHWTILSGVEG